MIVQSDDACQQLMVALKSWLDSAGSLWLNLFSNQFVPGPAAMLPGQFIAVAYPAYSQLGILGTWTVPIRDNAGQWHIDSGPWTFAGNFGGSDVSAWGWYLTRDSRVVFSEAFRNAVIIRSGTPGPTFTIRLTQGSQSVIAPGP